MVQMSFMPVSIALVNWKCLPRAGCITNTAPLSLLVLLLLSFHWSTSVVEAPTQVADDRHRTAADSSPWHDRIDLPDDHLAPYFFNNPTDADACRQDIARCPFRTHLDRPACWGYESDCPRHLQYSYPRCEGHHDGWVKTKAEQHETFYGQADFGYVRDKLREMYPICRPENPEQSSLTCTQFLRYCRGRRIVFNFTSLLHLPEPMRYRMDVIGSGQVGGHCRVDGRRLAEEATHVSPLQSWAPELRHFTRLDGDAYDACDVVVHEPTYVLKLDATVNMYHHFCDYFNLYASQHMDGGQFGTDIRILVWDTMPYRSNFGVTWRAFTRHPVQDLKRFAGKTVCFDDVVMPFLPRQIYGLYYNTPLVNGCEGSGLFRAFSHHVLHRLRIKQEATSDGNKVRTQKKIRVTMLSRSTTYRRILNEDELIEALRTAKDDDDDDGGFNVRKVDFTWSMPFERQLQITQNTDILIGMHGAGLTHLLFLPDWAAVFEIYHCEDSGCYRDLARLRGIRYFTWEKPTKLEAEDEGHHPTDGAHAKFTNYKFDADEFVRIVRRAAEHVRRSGHPDPDNGTLPRHGGEL